MTSHERKSAIKLKQNYTVTPATLNVFRDRFSDSGAPTLEPPILTLKLVLCTAEPVQRSLLIEKTKLALRV